MRWRAWKATRALTGAMVFDPNSKNTVPLYLATVHDGGIRYRRYGMEKAMRAWARAALGISARR